MGAHLHSRNGGRGGRNYRKMGEINVTPFVDVMLVLLVIFMATAPLLTVAVPVDLPQSDAKSIGRPDKPLIISVRADGEVYLQETRMALPELIARLRAITATRPDAPIYVRGDKSVPYGRIMSVMGSVSSAGFKKVALVAELPNSGATPGNRK